MAITDLFAGITPTDHDAALPWYARLLGRPPDIVVAESEALWHVAAKGWTYVVDEPVMTSSRCSGAIWRATWRSLAAVGWRRQRSRRSVKVNTSDRQGVSIYEAAGGQEAFLRLATAHHQRCLDDPVLNHPFSHPGHPRHVERLAAYWAEVFGGPPAYTQEAGGHSFMLDLHARTQADDDLGSRFLRCFVAALDDAGLPADDDLRAALRAYMEWAVRDVMSYAPADAVVPAGQPVPRWTWAGLHAVPDRRHPPRARHTTGGH